MTATATTLPDLTAAWSVVFPDGTEERVTRHTFIHDGRLHRYERIDGKMHVGIYRILSPEEGTSRHPLELERRYRFTGVL